ncbi:hypothetical protein Cs308_0371 [Candidatus Chlamydia sanziniae]|uniref:Cell shape-determining protein MreC n=2 Tax=Candidatus Chlamydia sanziniae TaxID=1806891 RepID=A0A1A9HWS8_9CHLA|nr:hypothetical protein Cs308_0371 [Candidatus Chlamydia sanziniae]
MPKELYEAMHKHFVSLYTNIFPKPKNHYVSEHSFLEVENLLLNEQIIALKKKLLVQEVIDHKPPVFPEILTPYFHKLIESHVIYRDPAHWASSCWVDVGKEQGIKKNSPVISGKVLVGLVDYVGINQARVRLITDVGMKPSVIAMRGGIQAWWVKHHLRECVQELEQLSDTYILEKDKYNTILQLKELISRIQSEGENQKLLRGTLSGTGGALWKQEASILQGEEFCFAQQEKDLLPGDILVTTGLDGIFPPGLLVARVTKIFLPQEGACTFKIEAHSLEANLNKLSHLLILPPMEFNPNDRPDIFGLLWD